MSHHLLRPFFLSPLLRAFAINCTVGHGHGGVSNVGWRRRPPSPNTILISPTISTTNLTLHHSGEAFLSAFFFISTGRVRSLRGASPSPQNKALTLSRPRSHTCDQARASQATAFRAIVQLRRPRHFDSPPTQHHAYPSRSSHQSSRMRRDEPVSIR